MMITKWVDMGADVEVNIDAKDIRSALSEAFEHVTRDDFDSHPTGHDVMLALNSAAAFINGLKDEHMLMLSAKSREIAAVFMEATAKRLRAIAVEDAVCGCGRGEGNHTALDCGVPIPEQR